MSTMRMIDVTPRRYKFLGARGGKQAGEDNVAFASGFHAAHHLTSEMEEFVEGISNGKQKTAVAS